MKMTTLVPIPLITSIIGFIFSMLFQDMAYWSDESMLWYWVGASLSYTFSILAIILLLLVWIKITRLNKIHSQLVIPYLIISLISIFIGFISIVWTTFIIIAWQSGF